MTKAPFELRPDGPFVVQEYSTAPILIGLSRGPSRGQLVFRGGSLGDDELRLSTNSSFGVADFQAMRNTQYDLILRERRQEPAPASASAKSTATPTDDAELERAIAFVRAGSDRHAMLMWLSGWALGAAMRMERESRKA